MKKTLFLLAAATMICSCNQSVKYQVTLSGLTEGEKAYLFNAETQTVMDSVDIQEGVATFTGEQPEAIVASITTLNDARTSICKFILDGTPLEMQKSEQKCELAAGSEVNKKYDAAQKELMAIYAKESEIYKEYIELRKQYEDQIPDSVMQSLNDRDDAIQKEALDKIKEVMEANKDNLIPVAFAPFISGNLDKLGVEFVTDFLKDYPSASREGMKMLNEQIEGASHKAIGAEVTDFEMDDLQGNKCHLTDFVGKGNYVLVDFWASWCGPCRAEMPNVKAAYEKYHEKGFEIVGVSFDNNKEAWEKAVNDLGITWPQMSDLKGWQSIASGLYNIRAIPSTILFDPEGKVAAVDLRGDKLEEKLAELIK